MPFCSVPRDKSVFLQCGHVGLHKHTWEQRPNPKKNMVYWDPMSITIALRVDTWYYINTAGTETDSKEKHGLWDPMPELTKTSREEKWNYINTAGTEAETKEYNMVYGTLCRS